MADTTLPEGTDSIVSDADMAGTDLAKSISPTADAPTSGGGFKDALKTSSDKLRGTASDKAMGFVSQGIERSSGALSNVSALVGDTASSLDERLGAEYGDYARSAAKAIDKAATSLAGKDAQELIGDARAFVKKSPGIALAGAAILGFALVRVVKSGLDGDKSTGRKG